MDAELRTTTATRVLDLQDITKRFGSFQALSGVSFSVARGEIVALLGPSGCGKTTTLRMIAGFESPDAGQIVMNGRDVAQRRPYERSIGLVFQDYALFPHMTVAQNIAFGMRHRGTPKAEIPDRTEAVLARVHLAGLGARKPSELSGGQQQRVALARALVTEPDVMLLDEPLSNLDAKLRHYLRVELREILTESGATAIIVTHDQEEAMGLADRIVLMNAGRIEQIDTPTGLYARPRTRFAADFIGQGNWFDGVLASCGRVLETEVGALTVAANGFHAGARLALCVRPERMALVAEGAEPLPACIPAVLDRVEHLGPDLRLWLRLESGQLVQTVAKYTGHEAPARGARVTLGFDPAEAVLLPPDGQTAARPDAGVAA
jgi:putative spermidine/putrescine transport system ATP-binding protein/putrescine transport system ATP-binding protein